MKMKVQSLLVSSLILAALPLQAGEYQSGYTSESRCFKSEYREEYIPGNQSSPSYVKFFKDKFAVPCGPSQWRTLGRYRQYQPDWQTRRNHGWVTLSNNHNSKKTGRSCSAASTTTGGLVGGGIAAALSKKEAYGWSVPLGAVLGMGITNANC